MSLYYNDYIIASNNSINDNKHNAEIFAKSSASGKIKKILKQIVKLLKHKRAAKKASKKVDKKSAVDNSEEFNFWGSDCHCDNSANEQLEAQIISEIQECPADAAVFIYDENESCEIQPIYRDDLFVPVNFARTEAGTFFWTTKPQSSCDIVSTPASTDCHSTPAYHSDFVAVYDRWAQA